MLIANYEFSHLQVERINLLKSRESEKNLWLLSGYANLLLQFSFYYSMATLLSKLRIEFSDIIVIPDINKKAEETTKNEFEDLIEPLMYKTIFDSELIPLREKTNRHLRLRELLLQYSKDSALIVM